MPRTLIAVDRDSSEPLYRQVRKAIEHGIAVGTLHPDRRLPSSRELARELGLSRNTITLAYQELIAEGFVESRLRKGLFVNREMRKHCSVEPETPATTTIDWSSRIRRVVDDGLPHLEKRPDWFTYPYPFLAGQVDVQAFPARAWARCLRDALFHPHVYHSLQDSLAADDPMLVAMIQRELLPTRGIEASPDQILVTLGSQQGLELLAHVLLDDGSTIAVEEPGYLDARHIFLRAGARLHPIPVDGSGLRPPRSLAGIDLLHLTPSHHHPTNVTLSIGRRRELLALARASGTIVVEDDYDAEFRYQGSPSPALKALDRSGHVVYLGTVSKFLAPGLRIGYLVGAPELVSELRNVRRYVHRHPPGHSQRALALLVESGEYHRAVRRYRTKLQRKWEAITAAVNRYLPWRTTPPAGGVSLWMTGPEQLDARRLAELAERRGALLEPGDVYFLADPPPLNHFRLGFAATPLAAIDPGIRVVADAVETLLE